MVAGAEQTLHHQSRSHGIKQTKVFWDAALLKMSKKNSTLSETFNKKTFGLCATEMPGGPVLAFHASSYQCVGIVAFHGAILDNVSFEDDEKKKEAQHHITDVTEYVVERTVKAR